MRTIAYTYDGLQRLIGAQESPGTAYAYQYDLAGNRTQVAANGAITQQHRYDAAGYPRAGDVQGGTYDAAGNLTGDGTSTNSYDDTRARVPGRLTAGTVGAQGSTYSYNGDGTLVGQASGGVTTGYAQDLAGGQSQVLAITTGSGANAGTVDQLWGLDRLAALNPATGVRAWYGYDGQGTARQLLNDAGHVTASANYDPYGGPEGAALPSPFGYTGELTDPATGSQYLRARWYRPGQGTLLGVDPALDSTGQAYSYANDNPANGADPSGRCTGYVNGQEYQLEGIEGTGACDHYIEGRLEGRGSAVAGPLEAHQSAFNSALDAELAKAAQSLAAGQDFTDTVILNPGQCPSYAACASDRRVALADAEQLQPTFPDAVVNGSFAGGVRGTDLCLGAQQVADPVAPPKGGASDVIGIILFGGTVIVLVVVIKFLGPHLRLKPPVGVPPTPVPPTPTPGRTCKDEYPGFVPAANVAGYKYRTFAEALTAARDQVKDQLLNRQKNQDDTNAKTGPCGWQSYPQYRTGNHYNIRRKNGDRQAQYVGAIVRCSCCVENPSGPYLEDRYNFVQKVPQQ